MNPYNAFLGFLAVLLVAIVVLMNLLTVYDNRILMKMHNHAVEEQYELALCHYKEIQRMLLIVPEKRVQRDFDNAVEACIRARLNNGG